jgi:phosphoenolpyruvate-protein phosphotransferase
MMKEVKGISASKGIVIGKAFLYLVEDIRIEAKEKDSLPFKEKKKILEKAIENSRKEITDLYERTKAEDGEKEAEIFKAHLLFLEDPMIIDMVDALTKQGFSVAASVDRAFEENAKKMEQMENVYFKERAKDIRDVAERVIRHILNKPKPDLSSLQYPAVVIAKDLTPSDTASLDRKNTLGFATDMGGATSHTAILAEAFGIPAVVNLKHITEAVKNREMIILDGEKGKVIINPDEDKLKLYREKERALKKEKEKLEKTKFLKAVTKSGKRIEVSANIGNPKNADAALNSGAEGIGLYRTEFLFLDRATPPTEEEQFEAYRNVIEKFDGKPVIIRTLDIGGDKQMPYLNIEKEANPFLGVRGMRLCLQKKDLFKTQLRAILHASAYGKVRIMYPMIAVKEEILQANRVLNGVKEDLIEEGMDFDRNIEVGIMVEIPSAALTADILSDYVDFFSIGTNDLDQYTFAADRTNQNLTYLYQPLNPAMLKLIEMTIHASHKKGKWTGMCGEMAGDPEAIPILVELGIDELSMSPQKIPQAKKIIRNL